MSKKCTKWLPLLVLLAVGQVAAAGNGLLWRIGSPDHDNAGFALAPNGYAKFKDDAVFVVGQSDAKRDWPYVQPGPADAWAGSRRHTFTIIFGIRQTPPGENAKLDFDLLDTQGTMPPKLRIEVNGQAFDRLMPAGAGDASVSGNPSAGKPHHFAVEFPATLLQAGGNVIEITTVAGSWMLYGAVALEEVLVRD